MDPEAFDELVTYVLARIDLRWSETLDLARVAELLGAAEVVYSGDTPWEGQTGVRGDQIVITISTRMHPTRRRFTLAHELAHLVLLQPGLNIARQRRDGHWQDQERFCNEFAASLLMPKWWLKKTCSNQPPGLAGIREVALQREVSLSCAGVRLRRVLGWRGSLIRWHRLAYARWRIAAAQYLQPDLRKRLEFSAELGELLEARRAQATISSETLPVPPHGYRGVRADLQVASRTGFMYLR